MAQNVKAVCSLAIASVKAIDSLAIASVKTVVGVDNTSGGGGTPALVQSISAADFGSDPTATLNGIAGGNLMVAVGFSSASGQTLDVSGGSLTWTQQFAYNAATYTFEVWTAPSSGSTCAATMTGGGSAYRVLFLSEVSGASALNQTPTHLQASGTTGLSSPSQTTDAANCLVINHAVVYESTTYSNLSNGYAIKDQRVGADFTTEGIFWLLKAAAGSTSHTFDQDSGNFANVPQLMLSLEP